MPEPSIITPTDKPLGGCHVGTIRIGEQLFGLVVAPKAGGEAEFAWSSRSEDLAGARSFFDGMANTVAMAEAGSAAANWARGLGLAGHTDWYIPAATRLELLYRRLKPTAEENYVYRAGDNPSSVPAGYPYTETDPGQTIVEAFQTGGAEAFDEVWYWSSTQFSRYYAWTQDFLGGGQDVSDESFEGRVRAVRRFLIE